MDSVNTTLQHKQSASVLENFVEFGPDGRLINSCNVGFHFMHNYKVEVLDKTLQLVLFPIIINIR